MCACLNEFPTTVADEVTSDNKITAGIAKDWIEEKGFNKAISRLFEDEEYAKRIKQRFLIIVGCLVSVPIATLCLFWCSNRIDLIRGTKKKMARDRQFYHKRSIDLLKKPDISEFVTP
jgi:hypothetical protein